MAAERGPDRHALPLRRPDAARRPRILLAPANGGAVALNLATGTYLRLNDTAATIARLHEAGQTPEEVARALAARWSIPHERALADAEGVVRALATLSATTQAQGRRPTVRGVAHVGRQWLGLPAPLRRSTLLVTPIVALVEVGLRFLTLPSLARCCGARLVTTGETSATNAPADSTVAEADLRRQAAIRWVLNRWSFDGTCLRQALGFAFLVRRRRPLLHLGLLENGAIAHAWIEVDGVTHDPAPTARRFSAGTEDTGASWSSSAGA